MIAPARVDAIENGLAREMYFRAADLGFKLTYDDSQRAYWLSWPRTEPRLSQPCVSLAAVLAALERGSPWLRLVATVGGE